jgi:hypothetical protein
LTTTAAIAGVLTIFCNNHAVIVVGLSMKPNSKSSAHPQRRQRRESPQDGEDTSKPASSPPPKHKIEFVNFWGSKVKTGDDMESINPRKIPCVETLDLHDGPLPPGAYVMEGKSMYEPKATCRVALNVQINKKDPTNDRQEMVRRLQKCIDAGFQTFQMQHQTRQGMELIAKMRQDTPSYIETHWSLRHKIPTSFHSRNPHRQQLETRESILNLIAQTRDHALDSLQLVCNPNSPYTLDVLNHLAEVQREGLIRSIGVKGMPLKSIRQARKAGLADVIDFQHQEGNLFLPPSGKQCDSKFNVWMDNALASSLLTASLQDPLQMTRAEEAILSEWAKRREAIAKGKDGDEEFFSAAFSTRQLWHMYQDEVSETLLWIALKHRVSPTAVAIRWALECGSDSILQDDTADSPLLPPVVSSAVIDCNLSVETFNGLPVEWRKVFRFELDEEDKESLQACSAPTLEEIERKEKLRKAKSSSSSEDVDANPDDALNDWERELLEHQKAMEENDDSFADEKYPGIDFSNKSLWL